MQDDQWSQASATKYTNKETQVLWFSCSFLILCCLHDWKRSMLGPGLPLLLFNSVQTGLTNLKTVREKVGQIEGSLL